MRFDQFYIGTILNDRELGIYSPAVKFSEMWYFIPIAFVESMFPVLIQTEKKNDKFFKIKSSRVFYILLAICLIFCISEALFAFPIIKILLGKEYLESVPLLRIYVWGTMGSVIKTFFIRILIIKNKRREILLLNFINLFLNICFNLLFVSNFGLKGAALSTILSYNIVWLYTIFFSSEKDLFKTITSPKRLFMDIKKILTKKGNDL